jgi:hypothetical protein
MYVTNNCSGRERGIICEVHEVLMDVLVIVSKCMEMQGLSELLVIKGTHVDNPNE